jgi:hypothetical protein
MQPDTHAFEQLFHILREGTPAEIKEAKKCIDKKWNTHREEFTNIAPLLFDHLQTFDSIVSPINKAGFISGIRLFYLALADDHFSQLKDFIVKNVQDPDGRIREAARKTAGWLSISLTSRASPFVYPIGTELTEKQKTNQIIAEKQYIDFVTEIEVLIEKYDDHTESEVEYVSDMKPSIHKSLQQIWNELTEKPTYRHIIEKYHPVPFDIFIKRKEIEHSIVALLSNNKDVDREDIHFDVDDIKQRIYEEQGSDTMQDILALFDYTDIHELQTIMAVITDAWNYFPHKVLDGKSPQEMYM